MAGIGSDDFRFDIIGGADSKRAFQGYNSEQDPTTVDPRYAIRGTKNMYLTNRGTWAVRPGLKLIGDENGTEDGVVASFEFETVQGDTLPIQVLESGAMRFFANGIWNLLKTFDKTRFVFTTWWNNFDKLNEIIMVNGSKNLYAWTGAFANYKISAAQTVNSVVAINIPSGQSISGGPYVVGQQITIAAGNNDAVVTVLEVDGLGAPSRVDITNIGSGYSTGSGIGTSSGGPQSGFVIDITQVENTYSLTNTSGDRWSELGFSSSDFPVRGSMDVLQDGNLKLLINGSEYTYFGGADTDTLTGVFPNPSSSLNDLVIQDVITTVNTPDENFNNDFCFTINNSGIGSQLVVGSYTSRIIYISFSEQYNYFVNTGDVIYGDPDFVILDEFPRGGISKGGSAYIAAGNNVWYIITPNTPIPYVASVGRIVITTVDKQVGASNSAALAHEFIDAIGESIIYLAQDHQLRSYGTVRNISTQKTPSLSKVVHKELIEEDFTGGCIRAVDEFVYIVSPISGKTFLYQVRDDVDDVGNLTAQRYWQPYQEWNISRVAVIDGTTSGYSAEFPQLYQLWDTNQWHDDTPGGPAFYTKILRMAYRQFSSERAQLGSFDKVYYEGYILDRSGLSAIVYNDYQGATNTQKYVLSDENGSAVLYGSDGITLIGDEKIGDKNVGGGIPDPTYEIDIPKFRVIQNVLQDDCFEYGLELNDSQADSRWEILALGPDTAISENNPVQLQRND